MALSPPAWCQAHLVVDALIFILYIKRINISSALRGVQFNQTHVALFQSVHSTCVCEVMEEPCDHQTVDLLEECWFFGNLLDRKARMLRCYSDPSSSSSFGQEMLPNNSQPCCLSTRKLHVDDDVQASTNQELLQSPPPIDFGRVSVMKPVCHSLLKSPSLPIDFGSEKAIQGKGSRRRITKSSKQQSPKSSEVLPPRHASKNSYTSCEEDEEESDFSLSKLIQQPTIQELLLSPSPSQPPIARSREDGSGQPLRRSLLRSPSLPSGFGRENPIQEKESHRRTSKSRQPSPVSSSDHVLLPPRHSSKGMAQSYSIPRSRNTTEAEGVNEDNIKEMRRRYLNHSKSRKNLTDFESQEVQGFKDLGFKFDNQDLNPSVVNILPGLQVNKTEHDDDDLEKDKVISRPYLSDEWLVQSYGPKIPHWGAKKSPEHMKAQIKYWARAVASNVH